MCIKPEMVIVVVDGLAEVRKEREEFLHLSEDAFTACANLMPLKRKKVGVGGGRWL